MYYMDSYEDVPIFHIKLTPRRGKVNCLKRKKPKDVWPFLVQSLTIRRNFKIQTVDFLCKDCLTNVFYSKIRSWRLPNSLAPAPANKARLLAPLYAVGNVTGSIPCTLRLSYPLFT